MLKQLYESEEKQLFSSTIRYFKINIGIMVAFLLMFLYLSLATTNFLTLDNWINVLRQVTTNTLLSIGVMMAITICGIDLTVGAVIALSGCITTKFISELGISVPVALAFGCLSGILSGLLTGTIIAYTRMPPFVVTLAVQNINRGAAYLVANGQPIRLPSEQFEKIGTGYLGPIPYPVLYVSFILIITYIILNKTQLGRHIYAVGGNREAARFSGIKIKKVEIFVYTYSGLMAAVAGIVLSARMASGQPAVGLGYETDAVAASVLGGTSMSGGISTVGGMLIGVLVLGVLSNGLNLLGVNSFWQYVAKGIVILIAVYLDIFRKRKRKSI